LSGCAAIKYELISYDSPKPDLPGIRGCLADPARRLAPGDECLALVRADQYWSDTGVIVQKGAAYRVTVPPGQAWFDSARINEPPFGEPGSRLMNVYARYLRKTGGAWFSLIGEVVTQDPTVKEGDRVVDIGAAASPNCASVVFTAGADGPLALYPNDAKGPDTHPTLHYENNSGQIWVRVRWLKDRTGPATPTAEECVR
jgi:hypothetical protein